MLLLAGEASPYFVQAAFVLIAGAIVAYLAFRIGLKPIIGFLLAGVLIGPHALGLVTDQELIDAIAEIGVLLLLFTIGIEFSLDKLAKIKRLIFGAGGLQVGLTTALVTGILLLFDVPLAAAIFTGLLAALSSTAIVLRFLGSEGALEDPPGQAAVGILIFQDLAIIPMVLFVPMLAGVGGGPMDMGKALGMAVLLIVVVLVGARRIVPKLLEAVAKTCSQEIFLLAIIAICFGTAYLTSLAGVSLSLGAFLAGLVVSESRYSQMAFGEIMPLQILFVATFFVSVGMLLDVGFVVMNLPLVIAVVLGALVIKLVVTTFSVRALGYGMPTALGAGLALAQLGEFSFVLERAGREVGLSPFGTGEEGVQAFIAATVLLMIVTPAMTRYGLKLAAKRPEAPSEDDAPDLPHDDALHGLVDHVIVAGYGTGGNRLAHVLAGSGVPFAIVTLSPTGAAEAEASGMPVLRGDPGRLVVLEHVGLRKAKMLVIPDDDPHNAERIALVARTANPTIRIVARTMHDAEAQHLERVGMDYVVASDLESVVQIFADVLRAYQTPEDELAMHESALRAGGYGALLAGDALMVPPVVCDHLDAECRATRVVTLHAGQEAVGMTAEDFAAEGLTVQRLLRDGHRYGPTQADPLRTTAAFQVGDTLTLAGDADAFARGGHHFTFDPASAPAPTPHAARPASPATEDAVTLRPRPTAACDHLDHIRPVTPQSEGCAECIALGDTWVHLRVCMTCGHVGCCDSSKNKHATAHYHTTGHPIVRSLEPSETWGWCYEDEVTL